MKVRLAEIPAEGLRKEVRMKVAGLSRVTDTLGQQSGRLEADLKLVRRDERVTVTGQVRVVLAVPCNRCLEPVPASLEEDVEVVLAPDAQMDDVEVEHELSAGELDVTFYAGEEIDLLAVLEDEVLLMVPEVVAPEDEDGRCTVCGRTLDDLYEAGSDEEFHPFAQMKQFLN